jgi:predicted nucleic acid-binding protein
MVGDTLFMTAISRARLLCGVWRLPDSKRKTTLAAQLPRVLELFRDRTLVFDAPAADCLAEITGLCEGSGRKAQVPQVYIASIAKSRGFAVATRNASHFEDAGVAMINPCE